eukprot:2318898-Amphidinium_carterae.1
MLVRAVALSLASMAQSPSLPRVRIELWRANLPRLNLARIIRQRERENAYGALDLYDDAPPSRTVSLDGDSCDSPNGSLHGSVHPSL